MYVGVETRSSFILCHISFKCSPGILYKGMHLLILPTFRLLRPIHKRPIKQPSGPSKIIITCRNPFYCCLVSSGMSKIFCKY